MFYSQGANSVNLIHFLLYQEKLKTKIQKETTFGIVEI